MKALEVLYHDNHLLVVLKPPCQPIVPDSSGDVSLLDDAKAWVKHTYQKPGDVFLGVVHRLDRPVGGVVVFARTSKAASRLSAAWQRHEVQKTYLGWSRKQAPETMAREGEWQQWLWKDRQRNRVFVGKREEAKEARTSWLLREVGPRGTLIHLKPHTGRAHQLRVACATAGLPLAGDLKYGAEAPLKDKSIGLWATALELKHPTRDEVLRFEAPLPGWAKL